jgi:hypothetical protein
LPGLLENYREQDVFKADESGRFFQCLPDNILTFRQEKCHSGRHSKKKVTLLLATNMDGSEKIKLLLIRKSKNLRYFRGIKWLLVGTVIAGSLNKQSSWIQRIFRSGAMRIFK